MFFNGNARSTIAGGFEPLIPACRASASRLAPQLVRHVLTSFRPGYSLG